MAKKIVALYIDDTSLRLMVSRGKRINKLAEAQLQLGDTEVKADIKENELTTKVRHLLKSNKVRSKKVILGISGRNCLTRPITLPQLPKTMLDEAVTREAKRVLPVPTEQLYLSWQIIPAPGEKTQVFLTATPRHIADHLLGILRQMGLKPYLMDIKPLALARVVKESTAIIVDVQPNEFDIVIMSNGIPQPVRTIPFPNEAQSQRDRLSMVREDLKRTIEFYNANNPETPLGPDTSIYVAGELAEKPKLGKSLSEELGYPVLPLSSPLKNPKNFDLNHYLVNVGLTLKELEKEAGPLIANLNTLPVPYRTKPISVTRVLAVPSAAAVLILIVGGVLVIQTTSSNIAATQDQLTNTTHILEQKQAMKKELNAEIAEIENKIATAETKHGTISEALNILDDTGDVTNGDLLVTTASLLSSINLTSVTHSTAQLTISGKAPNEDDILAYARALDNSGRFTEITVASIRRVDTGDADAGDSESGGEVEGEGEEDAGEEGEGEGEEDAGEEGEGEGEEDAGEEGEGEGEEDAGEEGEGEGEEDAGGSSENTYMQFVLVLKTGGAD